MHHRRPFLALCLALLLPGVAIAQPTPREVGWRTDLDELVRRLRSEHEVYRSAALPDGFEAAVASVASLAPHASDERMLVELLRLSARAGDGHTYVLPMGAARVPARALPVRIYAFSDGLFIVSSPEDRALEGAEVRSLGGVPASALLTRVAPYISRDNEQGVRWIGPILLPLAGMIEAITGRAPGDSATLVVRHPGARPRTVRLPFRPVPRMRGLPKLVAPPNVAPPTWLTRVETAHRLERLSNGALWVPFNQVEDAPNAPLSAFATRLDSALATGPCAVIVDVRHNNGGNADLLPPLLDVLARHEGRRPGRIAIITGRNTFSAAQIFISLADARIHPLFVGEPSSSRPNFVGEENARPLPWSGGILSVSNRRHESIPGDRRAFIAPALPVPERATDYFAGRDAALEATLAHFAQAGACPAR